MTQTLSQASADLLAGLLEERLDEAARRWLAGTVEELRGGVTSSRFAALLSLASRYLPRGHLAPSVGECSRAGGVVTGWNPERWSTLECGRVRMLLAREDLLSEVLVSDLEDAFRHADEGELRALYKSLCLLPEGQRFVLRAAEGCRTNILPVFESVACDNPYACEHFEDLAWNQMVIKALFVGAPLWRVYGLDRRLSPELARMALDLADERRSAGRAVYPELWMCLGEHAGERGLESLRREVSGSDTIGRRAAVLGLARAGQLGLLDDIHDHDLGKVRRLAHSGRFDQAAFRVFDPRE